MPMIFKKNPLLTSTISGEKLKEIAVGVQNPKTFLKLYQQYNVD